MSKSYQMICPNANCINKSPVYRRTLMSNCRACGAKLILQKDKSSNIKLDVKDKNLTINVIND